MHESLSHLALLLAAAVGCGLIMNRLRMPAAAGFILGASGGVGLAAIELAKLMGARVIACASTQEKLDVCKRLGADDVINYDTENLRDRIKELTKDRGVDIVHLAEFHVQHTPEMNDQRLSLLKTLHGECRRLSGKNFLLLPGEEPNVHLGGHWISLFPRPVYWQLHPKPGTPFEATIDKVTYTVTLLKIGSSSCTFAVSKRAAQR